MNIYLELTREFNAGRRRAIDGRPLRVAQAELVQRAAGVLPYTIEERTA